MPGLRRYVELLEAGVEGQHVGVCADIVHSQHFHRGEVHDREFVVFFAGDEGEPVRGVEGDAVRALYPWQWIPPNNFHGCWIDCHQLVLLVHSHEDVS